MNLKRTLKGTPKTPKKSQEYPMNLKRTLKGTPKTPKKSQEYPMNPEYASPLDVLRAWSRKGGVSLLQRL